MYTSRRNHMYKQLSTESRRLLLWITEREKPDGPSYMRFQLEIVHEVELLPCTTWKTAGWRHHLERLCKHPVLSDLVQILSWHETVHRYAILVLPSQSRVTRAIWTHQIQHQVHTRGKDHFPPFVNAAAKWQRSVRLHYESVPYESHDTPANGKIHRRNAGSATNAHEDKCVFSTIEERRQGH